MAMVSQLIYLEPDQKLQLTKQAKEKGGSFASEVREAVSQYLSGLNKNEVQELDFATQEAEKNINEMNDQLDGISHKLTFLFEQIEHIKGQR